MAHSQSLCFEVFPKGKSEGPAGYTILEFVTPRMKIFAPLSSRALPQLKPLLS